MGGREEKEMVAALEGEEIARVDGGAVGGYKKEEGFSQPSHQATGNVASLDALLYKKKEKNRERSNK